MSWSDHAPVGGISLRPDIQYSWKCGLDHEHTIECLWIWHDCAQPLGPDTVAPGEPFGWRPAGVGAHTLVQIEPLTITASVYWPDCCGVHGFITNGQWIDA